MVWIIDDVVDNDIDFNIGIGGDMNNDVGVGFVDVLDGDVDNDVCSDIGVDLDLDIDDDVDNDIENQT